MSAEIEIKSAATAVLAEVKDIERAAAEESLVLYLKDAIDDWLQYELPQFLPKLK